MKILGNRRRPQKDLIIRIGKGRAGFDNFPINGSFTRASKAIDAFGLFDLRRRQIFLEEIHEIIILRVKDTSFAQYIILPRLRFLQKIIPLIISSGGYTL